MNEIKGKLAISIKFLHQIAVLFVRTMQSIQYALYESGRYGSINLETFLAYLRDFRYVVIVIQSSVY